MIDSHAHISSEAFSKEEWEGLLSRAKSAGVAHILNICSDLQALQAGLALASQYPQISLAAACPPHDVGGEEVEEMFNQTRKALQQGKLKAVGETGLDYFYENSPKELQKEWLVRYLELANQYTLPVVIHCREAFADFFDILDRYGSSLKGVLHCFTGTLEEAQEVVKRGWMVSYSGIVTFKKSEALRKTLRAVPIESLLIETDSPYLAPPPHRGKRNEPAYVAKVAECIALEKDLSYEEVAQQTALNAQTLFSLPAISQ